MRSNESKFQDKAYFFLTHECLYSNVIKINSKMVFFRNNAILLC